MFATTSHRRAYQAVKRSGVEYTDRATEQNCAIEHITNVQELPCGSTEDNCPCVPKECNDLAATGAVRQLN
eukprot:6197833-Pleurochrysis_carterae.AAC.6